ncbi:hypothetical protein CEUSTIGMA_g10280.t1 [Chlamydomonas eustigma]|uniref:non-specific serine/threonine protein kinase n=1 Tax=Chlamydomonas eustigma TaxID=1157962 RepID=A0A250XIE9_9CHLO|nr:hypothetical protein CEUSTIGMA_g10280.t1 [Chlamydomonas eustigma]|eukprot:GAX82854.1 hypothetical protein CEUSTIGMA_g10280.t1 [Chlamydomonas eustigma]
MSPDKALKDRENADVYKAPRASLTLSDFNILGHIGDGSFATVILAERKAPNNSEKYAIKIVNKHVVMRNKMVDYVKSERFILDALDYDGIVKLKFTFQDADSLYFGLEYCSGGDLYEQIKQKEKLSYREAQFYSAEMVLMLQALRDKQVIHRDLKPENLLLSDTGHLKLIDFGSAKAFFLPQPALNAEGSKKARATSFVGTAEYVAPEVLQNKPLTYSADLWALGCIIYQMLAGRPPFRGGSEYLTFQLVTEREFSFPEEFPDVARDLVDKLLVLEAEDRLGASDLEELKTHPFFTDISWSSLREQDAPEFIRPKPVSNVDEALDWELTSLMTQSGGLHGGIVYERNPAEVEEAEDDSSED